MYWKYSIESGDLVKFMYKGKPVAGTVRGIIYPEGIEPGEELSVDEIDLDDFALLVKSGDEEVEVDMDDVKDRISEDERESDLPLLSERLRLSGGVGHV